MYRSLSAPASFPRNDEQARIELSSFSFIDISTWQHSPPARQWAVPNRIPLRQPSLLTGKGGGGKSIIALQLCIATVLGQDWLGMMPEQGATFYIGAEDEAEELHRRVAEIARHYGAQVSELIAGGFQIASLAGRNATFAEPDKSGIINPTQMFNGLHDIASGIQPRIIVLDTVSDVFGGDENNRAQVTAFVGLLRKLAMDANAAVILTAHPSQHGLSSGSGLSGSTAWHGKVRSQLYLKQAEAGPGRELQFAKNNYGPLGACISLVWQNGVFVPKEGSLEAQEQEQEAELIFLKLLGRFIAEHRNVTDKRGTSYAPKEFSKEQEASGFDKPALEQAMRRLLRSGRIEVNVDGPPSRRRSRLVLGDSR